MRFRLLLSGLLALSASHALSADVCPPTGMNTEWQAQCFDGSGETRRVKPEFIKNLRPNQNGVVMILIAEPRELVAVNRDGKVIIPGIRHTGDFDYPNAPLGISRFYTRVTDRSGKPAEKCGYFQVERFQVIVPASFDNCQPFKEEQTLACSGCTSYCTETDCQNSVFVGGWGVRLGRDGKTSSASPLPTLETVCTRPELVRLSRLSTGAMVLSCQKGPNDPFKEL
jgi:hypothetical protein